MENLQHTIKRWLTKKDWEEGNSTDNDMTLSDDVIETIAQEDLKIDKGELYHFELYETESGETIYHSNN